MTKSQLDINALTDGFVPSRRGLVAAGGLAIGTTLAMAGSAQAATFTVSNLNDSGSGSLRQAVLDANGIDSNLIRDDAGGMMPWLQWLHPIRLVVRETDSVEAVELLDTPPGPSLLP